MDWTVIKLLSWTESYFKSHDIDSPRLTAEILLGHSLGIKRLDLYLQYDRPLEKGELSRFKALIRRRVQKEPVAYIVGEKGFFESTFTVNPSVLIPRPDTEVLVETGMAFIRARRPKRLKVLELGVGSGAVVTSLARACPDHCYFGCDLSFSALEVARTNAENLCQTPVRFFQGNWLEAVREMPQFDLILSNPPYIPSSDLQTLASEIQEHEPRLALDGGPQGLDAIGQILDTAQARLAPGGQLMVEMGFDQREKVAALVAACPGYAPPEFIKDLAGHTRLVSIGLLTNEEKKFTYP